MKKTSWLYVFIACFLASCSSIQSFTFDELIPAETSFPEQLATVAVVNNMVAIPAPKLRWVPWREMERLLQKCWPAVWRTAVISVR